VTVPSTILGARVPSFFHLGSVGWGIKVGLKKGTRKNIVWVRLPILIKYAKLNVSSSLTSQVMPTRLVERFWSLPYHSEGLRVAGSEHERLLLLQSLRNWNFPLCFLRLHARVVSGRDAVTSLFVWITIY
jgi:hypothetical protein